MTNPPFDAGERVTQSYLAQSLVFGIVLLALAGCRHTPDPAWNGTWNLNSAKSQVHGRYVTLSIAPSGEGRIVNETLDAAFRCNGKESPGGPGRTTTCTQVNAHQWKWVNNGPSGPEATLWELSPDGNTFTIHSTETRPDGTEAPNDSVSLRRGQGTGFAGKWQDSTPMKLVSKSLVVTWDGSILRLAYADPAQLSETPDDGKRVPLRGPMAFPGSEISVKAIGSRNFKTEVTFRGKPVRDGSISLSAGGKTLRQESWEVLNPQERDVAIYERQAP
ncbi:MAG TPA: hypothetical protein VGJ21_05855 [Terracidiphilus sp.]|jgi:hypothetical protein